MTGEDGRGLTTARVAELRAQFGRNVLPEGKPRTFLSFFAVQFADVMVVIRCPIRIESGSSIPRFSRMAGLWSNRSSCDGAPDWNM